MKPGSLLTLIVICFVTPSVRAEAWPSLNEYVDDCVLIVICRTERFEEGFRYKVEETWKGVYTPELFYPEPAEGYLFTNGWHGNEDQQVGARSVFFFTASNQPLWANGKLTHHSTAFRIHNDKLTYASTSGDPVEYSVSDFRRAIFQQVRKKFALDLRERIAGPK